MPVIINELEVLTEAQPSNDDTAAEDVQQRVSPRKSAQKTSPDVIRAVFRHDLRRRSRSYAG
jgi:hypothetical protein